MEAWVFISIHLDFELFVIGCTGTDSEFLVRRASLGTFGCVLVNAPPTPKLSFVACCRKIAAANLS
jgi:hypothetical protein